MKWKIFLLWVLFLRSVVSGQTNGLTVVSYFCLLHSLSPTPDPSLSLPHPNFISSSSNLYFLLLNLLSTLPSHLSLSFPSLLSSLIIHILSFLPLPLPSNLQIILLILPLNLPCFECKSHLVTSTIYSLSLPFCLLRELFALFGPTFFFSTQAVDERRCSYHLPSACLGIVNQCLLVLSKVSWSKY